LIEGRLAEMGQRRSELISRLGYKIIRAVCAVSHAYAPGISTNIPISSKRFPALFNWTPRQFRKPSESKKGIEWSGSDVADAIDAADDGLSLPIISQLFGHTQVQTTARYAHLSVDPLRAATCRRSKNSRQQNYTLASHLTGTGTNSRQWRKIC
jgi:hypothetical protein